MNDKLLGIIAAVGCVIFLVGAVDLYFSLSNPSASDHSSIAILTSSDFSIPMYNSTINFGQNGICSRVDFMNETFNSDVWAYYWQFSDFSFDNHHSYSTFGISAKDCNVTIIGSDQTNNQNEETGTGWLNYTVSGPGKQSIDLGGLLPNLTVIIDGQIAPQNQGWVLAGYGDQIIVSGATSNVSIQFTVGLPVAD